MTLINRSSADKKVKVSNSDLLSGFLEDKLIAGPGITITKVAVAGIETLVASSDAHALGFAGSLTRVKCVLYYGKYVPVERCGLYDQTDCLIKRVAC
jgi:hypothetical protein